MLCPKEGATRLSYEEQSMHAVGKCGRCAASHSSGIVDMTERDLLYQNILNKIGSPPDDRLLPNLSPQQFSQRYQAVRRILYSPSASVSGGF